MSTVIPVPDNWEELVGDWDGLRNGYPHGDMDETVRDCVRRLGETLSGAGAASGAGPRGDLVLFWTLGLLTVAPYVGFGNPGAGVEDEAVAVLRRAARRDEGQSCAHAWHPYDIDVDALLEDLPLEMELLSSPVDQALDGLLPEDLLPQIYRDQLEDDEAEPANLSGAEILVRWQCPRTAPGFARAALDYLGATVR
ncbi:hypothetical protein [Streptomyces cavernicola]|uniref:Uncharacterized protein n=1 Tax=Streptomyces cavernicola TaxID=3043613 RepID=A0ABT6S524_9ACTN|nr:hypothetical protein [Streptomyces sp. B-S-A6]MDI3403184.1 hypothetical protein [Streptomyces sp. B-S-A6]